MLCPRLLSRVIRDSTRELSAFILSARSRKLVARSLALLSAAEDDGTLVRGSLDFDHWTPSFTNTLLDFHKPCKHSQFLNVAASTAAVALLRNNITAMSSLRLLFRPLSSVTTRLVVPSPALRTLPGLVRFQSTERSYENILVTTPKPGVGLGKSQSLCTIREISRVLTP